MFVSQKSWLKTVGIVSVVAVMFAVLMLGVVACGGDDEVTTTVEVTTSSVEETETSVEEETEAYVEVLIDEALVGVWYSAEFEETVEFTADGKMIVTSAAEPEAYELDYSVSGTDVVVSQEGMELGKSAYSVDGDVLSLADPETGEPTLYERAE